MKLKHIFILFFAVCFYQVKAAFFESENHKQLLIQWFQAAKDNDLKTLKKLSKVVDINATESTWRFSALMLAAIRNYENMVRFLLSLPNLDVNVQDYKGYSVLICLSHMNNYNMIKLLLKSPTININLQDKQGNSALIIAAQKGYQEIMRLLLSMPSININVTNDQGNNALMEVAASANHQCMALLLKVRELTINSKNKDGVTTLIYSREYDDLLNLIENKLLELKSQALNAIKTHDFPRFKSRMAEIGVFDDVILADGGTFIDQAFASNHPEIILYLLQNAENPQNLLERFPFEYLNPSSDLFKFCIHLAYTKEESIDLPSLESPRCAHCAKQDCSKLCSRCKKVFYCSQECQKSHWATHKSSCSVALAHQ